MSHPEPQPWSGQPPDPSTPSAHGAHLGTAQYSESQPHRVRAFPPINKHVCWHVTNWFLFWPTAIYALVAHLLKIDEAAYRGDLSAAHDHADKVRKHGEIAVWIHLALFAFLIVLLLFDTAMGSTT